MTKSQKIFSLLCSASVSRILTVFTAVLSILTICICAAAQDADVWREKNSSFDTFGVRENLYNSTGNVADIVDLFNDYFKTDYESAAALYEDRGIKQFVESWHVDNSFELIGHYRTARFGHLVELYDSSGNTVWQAEYGRDEFNGQHFVDDSLIFINQPGDYNMKLTLTNNNDVIYANDYYNGIISLMVLDVTDLLQAMGQNISSAYMFCWEDLPWNQSDFDYNDAIFIMKNIKANGIEPPVTPEPASMLIFGIGSLAGSGFLIRRKINRKR